MKLKDTKKVDNNPSEFIGNRHSHRHHGFDDVVKKIDDGINRVDDKDKEAIKQHVISAPLS